MHTVLDEASWLSAIADILSDAKDIKSSKIFKPVNKTGSNYLGGSISKYTKDLTMTFPTLVDNSLSPETASMISKANERNIISMLQMLFASMQLRSTDGKEIIERIYGNKYGLGKMQYDDYANAFLSYANPFGEAAISETDMAEYVKKMQDELKRPMKSFPTDSFSDNSLNDYSVLNINGSEVIKFNPVTVKEDIDDLDPDTPNDDNNYGFDPDHITLDLARQLYNKGYNMRDGFILQDPKKQYYPSVEFIKQYNDAVKWGNDAKRDEALRKFQQAQQDHWSKQIDAADADRKLQAKRDEELFKHQKAQQDIWNKQNAIQQQNLALQQDKEKRQKVIDRINLRNTLAQQRNATAELLHKQLLDSDIKKANEMQPSLIVVQYTEVDPNNDYKMVDQRSFVAGVKSRLISVDSSDIVDRITVKNKTKINFLNFIRATTGEINFFKDFILCLKQAKIDAKNSIKRGEAAEMWKTLESLAVKNKTNKLRKSGNDASAITTLVVNQETVNLIKKDYEINLENPSIARMILNEYNLLGLIIADESIEVVKFLYDGQDMFEQQAYSFLERENNDKSYKKIINLMSQNRRF